MSKRVLKSGKNAAVIKKVYRPTDVVEVVRLLIPAGQATQSAPLGPALGQRGIQSGQFVKAFNEKTTHIKPGIPTPVLLTLMGDRSYKYIIKPPQSSYFLMMAAGLNRGSQAAGKDIVGNLSLKHIYEIAKVKQTDEMLKNKSLWAICRLLIGSCKSIGIKVNKT